MIGRERVRGIARIASALMVLITASCSSGSHPPGEAIQVSHTETVSQGFNPGLAFAGTVSETVLAAGMITLADGDHQVSFVVFTGTDMGKSDVYLAVVDDLSPAGTPVAFSQALLRIFEHPRCQNCHGFPDTVPFQDPPSFFNHGTNPTIECGAQCHQPDTVGVSNWMPWKGLPELEAAGLDLDFRGKSATELVDSFNAWEAFRESEGGADRALEHFIDDDRIRWAVDDGRVPLGRDSRPSQAITQEQLTDLFLAWDAGGRRATAASALLTGTPLLVSQTPGGVAANGDSHGAHVVFVPGIGAGTEIGRLHVAFVSDADDLVTGTMSGTDSLDIYRSEIALHRSLAGDLSVTFEGTTLISADAMAPLQRGNGDSLRPVIAGAGDWITFESRATNLVTGFVDGNGTGSDIFLWRAGFPLELVSGAAASTTQGGNGSSERASLSADASVVAFESAASDLGAGTDTNGVRDIYYRCLQAGPSCTGSEILRASVRTDGSEATGGDSRHPSVAVRDGGVFIAFESEKTDLTTPAPGAASQIYLHDTFDGGTTVRLSERQGMPGNAPSARPALSPGAMSLVFETSASNLDSLRPDGNARSDIVRVRLESYLPGRGFDPRRININPEGAEATGGDSTHPRLTRLRLASGELAGEVVLFETGAENLGRETNSNTILAFADPRFGPRATITVTSGQSQGAGGDFEGTVGTTFAFDGSGSSDPDGSLVSFAWDFGDGGGAAGSAVEHIFAAPGTFEVVLTVTDDSGTLGRARIMATITP